MSAHSCSFHRARVDSPAAVAFGNKDVKNRMRNPVDGVAKEKLGELLAFRKGSRRGQPPENRLLNAKPKA